MKEAYKRYNCKLFVLDNLTVMRSKGIENKYEALKTYAQKYNLKWGFVRDIDEELFINNTEYVEDMSDDSWKPLEEEL